MNALASANGCSERIVGHSEIGRGGVLARARQNSCPLNISNAVKVADELLVTRVLWCFPSEDFPIKDTSSRPELNSRIVCRRHDDHGRRHFF